MSMNLGLQTRMYKNSSSFHRILKFMTFWLMLWRQVFGNAKMSKKEFFASSLEDAVKPLQHQEKEDSEAK